MEIENSILIAVISAIIAALALLWAIYTHFSTRKIARLTYKVSQLADFDVPESFLMDMPVAPLSVTVTSRGNKSTENVVLRLTTISTVENFEVSPRDTKITHTHDELHIEASRLNPSQQIKLFVRCSGEAMSDQIKSIDISHSEGTGINENEAKSIAFNFMGIDLVYDTQALATKIIRIGPFSFQ